MHFPPITRRSLFAALAGLALVGPPLKPQELKLTKPQCLIPKITAKEWADLDPNSLGSYYRRLYPKNPLTGADWTEADLEDVRFIIEERNP